MLKDILSELEAMSEADKASLLNTEFPEELEKAASAQIDNEQLADALYQYGWLAAERQVAEADGVEKIASEDLEAHNAAIEETGEVIENLLSDLGTAEIEDEAELQKEAQVVAALMFEGYSDFMDKLAASKGAAAMGAIKGALSKVKGAAGKAVASAKKSKVVKMVRKHPGKAALIAGGAVAGGVAAKKHMNKKASDATVGELAEAMDEIRSERELVEGTIEAGLDKLAAKGANKAVEFLKKHYGKGKEMAGAAKKHVKKHQGLYGLGAGAAAGAGAAHAAHKAGKK